MAGEQLGSLHRSARGFCFEEYGDRLLQGLDRRLVSLLERQSRLVAEQLAHDASDPWEVRVTWTSERISRAGEGFDRLSSLPLSLCLDHLLGKHETLFEGPE